MQNSKAILKTPGTMTILPANMPVPKDDEVLKNSNRAKKSILNPVCPAENVATAWKANITSVLMSTLWQPSQITVAL